MTSCSTSSIERLQVWLILQLLQSHLHRHQKLWDFLLKEIELFLVSYFLILILNSSHGNRVRIYDKDGIDAMIQILNSMEVYPEDESYKYYGEDSLAMMINFFDEKGDAIELLNICLDLTLNEYVLSFHKNIYKFNSFEIDKIHEICEL